MEIDGGIDCFFTELNGSLPVDHHRLGFFSDCMDYSFGNTILTMSIWRAWLTCRTAGHEDISEGLIVILSPSIIAPESLDLISHRVYSCLKSLVGGGAGFGYLISEQLSGCVPDVVVNE